jgi:acylphosphatase
MMSPIDESSDTAEIYVEGQSKLVEGFVRWCHKSSSKVGLSQVVRVVDVIEEEATGLYNDFYAQTRIDKVQTRETGVP